MKKTKTTNKKNNSKTLQNKNNLKIIILGGIVIFSIAILLVFFLYNENTPKFHNVAEELLKNNINVKSLPKTIEEKIIPPGYTFGFPVDNGLGNSVNLITLSGEQQKASIRFTAKYSGEISKVILHLRSNTENEIKVGIQDDNKGNPSGVWIGEKPGFVISTIDNKTKSLSVEFNQKAILEQGKAYHIVIEPNNKPTKDPFWVATYFANWQFKPLNQDNPDETWADPMINTLFFDGKIWKTEEKWPIFVVQYKNGLSDGQPYSLMAQWVILGDRFVGQIVTPYSDYNVGQISFVINKKGNPPDDFHYTIYDQDNNTLAHGIFAKNNEVSNKKQWHTISLDKPIVFEKNKLYRVMLSSPGANTTNYYQLFGHEFMLDRSIGYGSIRHYLSASYDAGKSFVKWYDADAAFKFITVE